MHHRERVGREKVGRERIGAGLLAALVAASLLGAPPAIAKSRSDQGIVSHAGAARRFVLNLYRRGDFVSQVNTETCVGASIQIMVNIDGPNDRSADTQLAYWRLARDLGHWRLTGDQGRPRLRGATPRGWALALAEVGEGRYALRTTPSLEEAVRVAASAVRQTGRPVGLLVWRGAHAWVLHGFEATADPLADPEARITAVFVSDPWYPRVSAIWGRSRAPNARLTPSQLAQDFRPWDRRRVNPNRDGKFVLVLPIDRATFLTRSGVLL